jgi:hypothetical protein
MNTIKGTMEKRSNHHLSFEKNKINRIVNENPIHYNRHLDIDYSFSQLMRYVDVYTAIGKEARSTIPLPAIQIGGSLSPEKNLTSSTTKSRLEKLPLPCPNPDRQYGGSTKCPEEHLLG